MSQLIVLLGDSIAGTLTRLRGGRLRFDYADDYRGRAGAVPLSISMPLPVPSHPDHIIRPWLWGLLPDNEKVLARWSREFQASVTSPFSLLATPIGHDCAGAVRFVVPDMLEEALARPARVTWLTTGGVAERLRELKKDSTAWLGEAFTGQFSLAGAQAKTALLYSSRRWGVPAGAAATSHILKPAVAGLDDHDLNEHLCLDAARRAGLIVARTRIETFDHETAIVVERYDRTYQGNRFVRVHQEDLCQALSVPPSRKYQKEGGPGPTQIAALFRRIMPARAAEDAVWRFIDALAWNWIIAGTDAHAKNYSLLLSGDQVRMAPFYDIASALPYSAHEKKLRMAMKIGNDYRVFIYHNPWPRAARELNVDEETLLNRVRDLAARAPDTISDAAGAVEVATLKRDLPGRLVDLVSERARRCAGVFDAPTDSHSRRPTGR